MQGLLSRRVAGAAAVAALAIAGAGCGDDDDDSASATTEAAEETTTTGGEADGGEVVEIVGVEYAFEGVPDSVPTGTQFSFTNEGVEGHELVALLIPEAETRPVSELVQLPEEELFGAFGGEPEPDFVILAAPGQTDVPGPVVGDGTLTEAGRYALICFLPVGNDPATIFDEASEGPVESDAPPHIAEGMFAELTVE